MKYPYTFIFISLIFSIGLIVSSLFFVHQTNAEVVTTSVTVTICGDGVVDSNEQCDDGGTVSGDGCSSTCQFEGPVCGNGVLETGEQCDDGNGLSGDGCNATCKVEGGGGGGIYIPPPVAKTKVIAIGKAYPASEVSLLIDGELTREILADNFGNFRFEVEDIGGGTFTFGFFALDSEGRRSITFNFTTSITPYTATTIGGILLPPTVEISKTISAPRDVVQIRGTSAPSSKIIIELTSGNRKMIQSVKADADGKYEYDIFTHLLLPGQYTIRIMAESEDGLISIYSQLLDFEILTAEEFENLEKEPDELKPDDEIEKPDIKLPAGFLGDFNNDSRINLIDLSVMFYYWKTAHPLTDLNKDGITDIFDFSILIYWWTG